LFKIKRGVPVSFFEKLLKIEYKNMSILKKMYNTFEMSIALLFTKWIKKFIYFC